MVCMVLYRWKNTVWIVEEDGKFYSDWRFVAVLCDLEDFLAPAS